MRPKAVLLMLCVLSLAAPRLGQIWAQDKKESPAPLALKVGDEAPDFTLPDDQNGKVTLSSFRGKKSVALAFYIFAFTGG
jgi:cytochrome oxidase Cu insertion factor (SCO1/SenC/PrrC family)